MRLLTVGDSFTYGEELSDLNNAWPFLLGKKLGYEVTNLAKPGSGNTRMIRNVVMNANSHDLIVIAWSHWARTEIADEAGFFDIWPGCNSACYNHVPWRKELVNYYSKHHNDSYLIEQFLVNVLLMQSYLNSLNKKYIMITAFGVLDSKVIEEFNEKLNLQRVDQRHYLGWPDSTMMEWTYGDAQGPNGHFLEDGHKKVADKIYEHIRNLSWIS